MTFIKDVLCLTVVGTSVSLRRKSTYFITTPIFYVNARKFKYL